MEKKYKIINVANGATVFYKNGSLRSCKNHFRYLKRQSKLFEVSICDKGKMLKKRRKGVLIMELRIECFYK